MTGRGGRGDSSTGSGLAERGGVKLRRGFEAAFGENYEALEERRPSVGGAALVLGDGCRFWR